MTIHPIHCFILLAIICMSCTASNKKCFIEKKEIVIKNASIDEILNTIGAYYHVKICNPQNVIGTSQTGRMTLFDSIPNLLSEINDVENGAAYTCYKDSVIYVSFSPFAEHFSPDPGNWPCMQR